MKHFRRIRQVLVLSLTLLAAWLIPLFGYGGVQFQAAAISTDYPAQLMHIATKDNSKVLTESGTADGSSVTVQALGGDLSPSWRFDRVDVDSKGTFFKICNAESGRLLTPRNYGVTAGASIIVYGSESHQTQHWYVVPVKTDHMGNDLYYKIVNYSDTSLALTQGASGITLENYTGADNQLWLLHADGLQGFAGYCMDDSTGNMKAGDIGGLFGEVVEVSTFDDLKKYATSDTPYTIVVTKNISVTNLTTDSSGHYYCPDGRIYVHSNKTIIGSYSAHTMNNVQFCTATKSGVGNNVIIKNFDLQHDAKSNGNDSIVVYFGSGENLWVDHVTFTGHSDYNTMGEDVPDWDKFLACCYDADYCTVSDCSFGLHEYGLILGYPDDTADVQSKYDGYPRMTLASNKFTQTLTRGPGLMRWGYYHSFNNYVNTFSMAYTVHSGCDIYAENCYYENGGNVICDWNSITYAGAYAESGSKFFGCNRTVQGEGTSGNPSYSKASTWRPASNYNYVKITADEAKTYCSNYSGCQNSKDNMMYLRFSKKGIPSAGYTETPSAPMVSEAASFTEGAAYRIKNVNSGLYMQVADAAAKNGANIQQWGSDGTAVHDIWKLYRAGDDYYYIASCLEDGGTYVLDVAGKRADNGTNIDLYQYNGGTNQQFKLFQNSDGSYQICTRASRDKSVIEVADASTNSGANVQEWEANGATCQSWILEPVTDPGCVMDVNVIYTFENVHSGMVMDVENGQMADNANVQQWGSNDYACQKWILKSFGSGNYYWICSWQDENFALKAENSANGGNIDIVAYSAKDSAQLFRFTKNLDGSYSIITHASKDACLVEVGDASKDSGANVQQWEPNNSACQKWNLLAAQKPVTTTVTTSTTEKTTTTTTKTTESTVTTEKPDLPVSGDVNDDGNYNIADLVLFQKWLLAVPDTRLPNWRAADLYPDGRLNGFDLTLMKQMSLKSISP